MAILISFDIDGTLEVGDPPGPITMDMVREAKDAGFLVGSCSDRGLGVQQSIWDNHSIPADFVAMKHRLSEVKEKFQADRYIHIGDRVLDQTFAHEAGFEFFWMDEGAKRPWLE